MPVQTSYTLYHDAAFEGQQTDLKYDEIISKLAEGSDIDFGRAVVRGTADDQAKLPSAANQEFIGITVQTSAGAYNSSEEHKYFENKEMNVLRSGELWVYVEQAVVPGEKAFYRYIASGLNTVLGRFRKDSDGDTATALKHAYFESTASAGELAKLRLYEPVTEATPVLVVDAAGVIPLTAEVVAFDSTVGAMAMTLADGAEGQEITLKLITDGGDVTITPANYSNGTAIILADAQDTVKLKFAAGAWHLISEYRVGLAQGAGAETIVATSGALPLTRNILLFDTTAGVSTATLADGAEGQSMNLKMTVDGGDMVVTPANLFDGTTITFDDVNDSVQLVFAGGNWNVIGTATATVA